MRACRRLSQFLTAIIPFTLSGPQQISAVNAIVQAVYLLSFIKISIILLPSPETSSSVLSCKWTLGTLKYEVGGWSRVCPIRAWDRGELA